MPLEDKIPVLDDRSYDDLVAEIRCRGDDGEAAPAYTATIDYFRSDDTAAFGEDTCRFVCHFRSAGE